ncbi:Anti-sigma-K factor rskA [Planctomycetes bacterium Pla163]|uniref:Anti-sigma-K factor rskA n=1 Tax=Rohdeia mirabilis TaxID=2528008 RepID=A0A518D1Q7_9BACT|nr:Anti-sigma-K factor rskA [Planctomycetes bacterium Pla163]
MSASNDEHMARLEELLAELELGRLDDAGRDELDALLLEMEGADPSFDADAELESVAEAIALTHAALATGGREPEPLPEHLEARLLAQAGRHFGWSGSSDAVTPAPRANAPARVDATRGGPTPLFARLGWIAAAAAALALVYVLGTADASTDANVSFDEFVARVDDEVVVDWTPTADPLGEGVSGKVVWSASAQSGVMRFEGLDVNDPTEHQYQLWIIDATREGENPVDGGVFDCTEDGVIEVPIDAKLPVGAPAAFAITLEKPGGVVVSKQEHLFLLAAVGS